MAYDPAAIDPNSWRGRARRAGLHIWRGQKVDELSDVEIRAAFADLAKCYGISYIWSHAHG